MNLENKKISCGLEVTLLEAFKNSYLLSGDKEFEEYLKTKSNKVYKNKQMALSALFRHHKQWLNKNFKLERIEGEIVLTRK